MELDFRTVKALSSPTRVKILREVLEKESTPTDLSKEVGKTKSTVSSHLDQLIDAGLLEKDQEEGRRRVTYSPTKKAQAIVEGRERKVKFSITSSIVTSIAGGIMVGSQVLNFGLKAGSKTADSAVNLQAESEGGTMGTMSQDAAKAAPETASKASELLTPENALLFTGVTLLSISLAGILYALLLQMLEEE